MALVQQLATLQAKVIQPDIPLIVTCTHLPGHKVQPNRRNLVEMSLL